MQEASNQWEWEIKSKAGSSLEIAKSVYNFRHLLSALIRKEFVLNYRQTILGPLWILFQPLLTLAVYVVVFGKLIGIPTGKAIPPVLFYLSGILLWNFFNDSFLSISNTFREHIHLYSKVYFPRIILPLSSLGINFLRFIIQFGLLIILLLYYILFKNFDFKGGWNLLVIPFIFLAMAMVSLGGALIAALLTAKYRDMVNLIGIVLRLLMFVTPVLYPLAAIKESLKWIALINPLTSLFELFRLCLLGDGMVNTPSLIYGFAFSVGVFVIAILLFNKRSSNLIDIA